jgi:predicted transcriptional regulator
MKRPPKSRHPVPGDSITRISISISSEDKAALERIAAGKKVSLAWVVRDALTKYLADATDEAP